MSYGLTWAAVPENSTSYGRPVDNNPSSATLEGCVEILGAHVQRIRDAVESVNHITNCLDGGVPQPPNGQGVKVESVPNGHIDALAQHLRNMDAMINELVSHHGRLGRAIFG